MTDEGKISAGDALTEALEPIGEHKGDLPMPGPEIAIASMALSMALKYHDVAIIKDGAMYNAFKLEGRNMFPISEEHVIATAQRFERFLMDAPSRLALMVLENLQDDINALGEDDVDEPSTETL